MLHDRGILKVFLLTFILLVAVGLFLAAMESGESQAMVTVEDESVIYATIIHRIYTKHDTTGENRQPFTLYLITRTDDSTGEPEIEQLEPVQLAQETQIVIEQRLSDLPTDIVWADSFDDVVLDPDTGQVMGDGLIITLGSIHPQPGGTVRVPVESYFANLGAEGRIYLLKQDRGEWTIESTTLEWIS